MKKVYFFNTDLSGGAANAAINTFNNIADTRQFDLSFFYQKDQSNGKKLNSLSHKTRFTEKHPSQSQNTRTRFISAIKSRHHKWLLNRYFSGKPEGFERFSFSKLYYKTPIQLFGEMPDLVHLNWIANWIDYNSFFKSIPDSLPIVWTLHDMNPFTGGCHYSWECNQYKESGCKICPQLGKYNNGKLAQISWDVKNKAFEKKNIHVVGNSEWTTKEAQKSVLFRHVSSFQTINCSIDFNIFCPKNNRQEMLLKYNIPDNNFIVAIGADGNDKPRKGIKQFFACLDDTIKNQNVCFLIFGEIQDKSHFLALENLNLRFTGKTDPLELSGIYSLADIMIVPSLYEAFGLTAIEAMACGTPVVAFKSGGLTDSVIDEYNGWLVESGNFAEMGSLISGLITSNKNVSKYGKVALEFAKAKFSKEHETTAYLNLYNQVL